MPTDPPIPVIDLFAGPGGLGEGFSAFRQGYQQPFHSMLAIEKDESAHATLRLRSFFRLFSPSRVPDEYYDLLRGELTINELYEAFPSEAEQADLETWCRTLGGATVDEVRRCIDEALCDADPWVLLGGPPCQPFSLAGRSRNRKGTQYSGNKEDRHELYVEYLQIIADFWPAVFVMENVRGLLSATFNGERMFHRIADDLYDPATAIYRIPGRGRRKWQDRFHYHLYPIAPKSGNGGDGLFEAENLRDYLVHCEDHGIPQARHRVILLGVRDDIAAKPELLPRQDKVPAGKVLAGLPPLRSGLSRGDDADKWRSFVAKAPQEKWFAELQRKDPEASQLVLQVATSLVSSRHDRGAPFVEEAVSVDYGPEWYLADKRLGGVCNHHTRGHMPSDLHRYLFASCFAKTHGRSPNLVDFPEDLLPDHASVERALGGGNFADRFRVQTSTKPSTTVVSHIAKDGHYYIHPDPRQCRSLTVREAARLQTFPDDYFFVGNRTQQYTQVGNAVPPLLAKQIAGVVHRLLRRGGLI